MPSILLIEKNASIKLHTIKVFVKDELFKKVGFKTNDGFGRHVVWNTGQNTTIELYGKSAGRAGQENKYDFPPPVDTTLFFGTCALVQFRNGEASNLTVEEWETVYEKLFGGFEDIGAQDSSDSEEEDDINLLRPVASANIRFSHETSSLPKISTVPRTRDGYVKDGFVVDDADESSDGSSEPEIVAKPKRVSRAKSVKNSKVDTASRPNEIVVYPEENVKMVSDPDTYLGCTNELQEEEYV